MPILTGFKMIIKNFAFLRFCFSVTVLYIVVTCIQFWYSDYAITVMKVQKEVVYTLFAVLSVTGPVFGVIFGGIVSGKVGGYNKPKATYLTAMAGVFGVVVAIPAAFTPPDLFALQCVLIWFLLFSGGYVMPNITGMMLNTVEEHLKTSANAIANMTYNLVGFLPAPYMYGAIADMGPVIGGNKRQAMTVNFCLPIFSALPVMYHAWKVRSKEKEDKGGEH